VSGVGVGLRKLSRACTTLNSVLFPSDDMGRRPHSSCERINLTPGWSLHNVPEHEVGGSKQLHSFSLRLNGKPRDLKLRDKLFSSSHRQKKFQLGIQLLTIPYCNINSMILRLALDRVGKPYVTDGHVVEGLRVAQRLTRQCLIYAPRLGTIDDTKGFDSPG